MGFFDFATPGGMFQKAKRDLAHLQANVSSDHVFNFFVTAYHISDYLDEPLRKKARKKQWLKLCGDVCNKAKHMQLDEERYGRPDPQTPRDYSIGLQTAGAPLDASKPGGSVRWRIQWPDGKSQEVVGFAQDVIVKWEEFFTQHEIPTGGVP